MFIFLYIPMIVLVVASFNTGKDITNFEGFTFQRYAELFQDEHLLQLLRNSIVVSVLSTLVATGFGTVAAIGIHNLKPKMRKVVMSLTNIPMTNPDIVTGVSLSLLFVFVGTKMLGQRDALTFWTLLIAHITFNLPYVILNVIWAISSVQNVRLSRWPSIRVPTKTKSKDKLTPVTISGLVMGILVRLMTTLRILGFRL